MDASGPTMNTVRGAKGPRGKDKRRDVEKEIEGGRSGRGSRERESKG